VSSKQERLFRPQFRPVAQLGDIVALRGQDGLVQDDADTPFYMVTHVEGSVALGVKGTVVVWCATAAPAAPYKADKNSLSGANLNLQIAAGATLDFQPDFFTLQKRQFGQFRFLVRAVPDGAAGALTGSIDDYDVRLSVPAANPRFGTQRLIGVLNSAFQGHLPSDAAAAPAQGTNFAPSANFDNDPFDKAARSELFVYGADFGGKVSITNNGAGAAAAGAIGLQMGLYLFNLVALPAEAVEEQWILGYKEPVPKMVRELEHGVRDVIYIPVAAQASPKSQGA